MTESFRHLLAARVLVIDPRPVVRVGLASLCRSEGVGMVSEAADGAQALALLQARHFDVVVLPADLPERMRVALAAQRRGQAWVVGLGDGDAPVGGVDALVTLASPAERVLAAVSQGLPLGDDADAGRLSADERDVLRLLQGGLPVADVAGTLKLPAGTVHRIIRRIQHKLGVRRADDLSPKRLALP